MPGMNPLDLYERLDRLTAALEALAASNMALVEAMAREADEQQPDDDALPPAMSRKR